MSSTVLSPVRLQAPRKEWFPASETFIRWTIPCFLFYLITYILPPPLPINPGATLREPSWQVVLTEGFLRGAQFGRDLVYTYGPWGFVENPRGDPRIYPWLVIARLILSGAFVLGISWIASHCIRRPSTRFLFLAWIVTFADPVYVLPMVLLAVAIPSTRWKDRGVGSLIHLLAVACALTIWIKFTSCVTVAALVAALGAQDVARRRFPVISLEIVASALAFWLLARQSLSGLPSFLHGAVSTAISYSSEMSLPGPYEELPVVAALLLSIVLLSAAIVWYRKLWSLAAVGVWVALLVLLQLKEAFVRYDSFHVWLGVIDGLVPCALILLGRAGCFDEGYPKEDASHLAKRNILIESCTVLVVVLSVAITAFEVTTAAGFERMLMFTHNLRSLNAMVSGQSLSADYRRQLENFERIQPLFRVPGSADVFPDDQLLLYGNGMKSGMPPIPQAFEAYNSYLSGRNAAFFRSSARPEFVFFDIAPLDKRYPSAADSLSWLALMDCYRPAGDSGRYLILRAGHCEDTSRELVLEKQAGAGEIVHLAPGGGFPFWIVIDMRLKPLGSVVAALARAPHTELRVRTESGWNTYGLTPAMAATGFLLSPLLTDPNSFGRLVANGDVNPRMEVRDLQLVQSNLGRALYSPSIGIRQYRLNRRGHQPWK